jgi:hypothetical protein
MQLRWRIFVGATRRRRIDRQSLSVSMACLIVVGVLIGSAAEPQSAAQALTVPNRDIEQRVLETVHELYGGTSVVRDYLSLTEPFKASSRWELVATKETNLQDELIDPNPVTICFVRSDVPDCSEKRLFPISDGIADNQGRLFHDFLEARVVYASADRSAPLLLLKACSMAGFNGNCGIYTFLFAYDHSRDHFYLAFNDIVPRNLNGTTRFVEAGPLRGDVVSATPTSNAPYGYFVSVYRSDESGHYVQILRYRSKTHYNDGNRLSVVDSDMPEILFRLGLWKPGDPLPIPFVKPDNCTKLSLIKGEEWCQ